jgi:hypothetical protein
MEKDTQHSDLEWAQILEYFTKRGKPLTKQEIQQLVDEEKRA